MLNNGAKWYNFSPPRWSFIAPPLTRSPRRLRGIQVCAFPAWELHRPVFWDNALWVYAGGRLLWSVQWSRPDSYAGQMVQDMLRYMFAKLR